jgi:3-methyladenine DNA glycosylase AlkD
MRENEVMEQLAALGTEQTRRTYVRHGATGELFGVLYSDLRKLQKRYGTDQALAEALWVTGNHDARVLATMVADPAAMAAPATGATGATPATRGEPKIASWAAQVANRPLLDAVAELAARTPNAVETMAAWIAADAEWVAATGWQVLAILAARGNGTIDDATFGRYLRQIESTIHRTPNWVRHAMNGALIAIGLRSQGLQAEALAAAQRIGKVVVDHGQTACKTPDAISYIRRAVLRRSEPTHAITKRPANEEPQMTDNMTQSSITKRNSNESAPKTSTKRAAAKPAKKAKKAAKKAGPKKVAKKAGAKPAKKAAKKAGAKPAKKAAKKAGAKKVAKKAGAKKVAKKAGAKKVAKKAGAKPAKKAAKKAGGKKAGKRAAANGAAPKKATKRASKGTSRKQQAPTTAPPPANP